MPRRQAPDPLALMVARRIQDLRHEKGLSISALAESSDISKGHLSNIERGLVVMDVDTLNRLACGLGIRLFDILTFPEQDTRQRLLDTLRRASLKDAMALEKLIARYSAPASRRKHGQTGICHDCGDEALPGKSRCQRHMHMTRLADRRRYARYRAQNRCGHCGEVIPAGRASCAKHG